MLLFDLLLHFFVFPGLEGGFLPEYWAKEVTYEKYNWMEKYVKLTKKRYDQIFPKENIVYISQASNNDLEYNHDDIYVLGMETCELFFSGTHHHQ